MADTQSRVWVGSAEGIIKYNGFEWIFDSAKMPFPAAVCNAMYRDDGGNLWFGIDTGVMRLQNPYPY
jgi:ligand-binding sensor domain-containing protein